VTARYPFLFLILIKKSEYLRKPGKNNVTRQYFAISMPDDENTGYIAVTLIFSFLAT
jgi:hypothetical protein